jgi:beta-phosphoglucomutase-like phosphatase (HAD superfamily)
LTCPGNIVQIYCFNTPGESKVIMPSGFQYLNRDEAAAALCAAAGEAVVIENVGYVYPRHEVVPLAPRITSLKDGLACVLMDMDGTTTTTENLCLDALETMIRRMTGHEGDAAWSIDSEADHPNLIGNSATKHVEYLVRKYGHEVCPEAFRSAYLQAAAYGMALAPDPQRRRELLENGEAIDSRAFMSTPQFLAWGEAIAAAAPQSAAMDQAVLAEAPALRLESIPNQVRAGLDIYYHRYHHLMANLAGYEGGTPLISPMPGVGILLALLKGWLGTDADACCDGLAAGNPALLDAGSHDRFGRLSRRFEEEPIRVALVTSSTGWETEQILSEVFRQLRGEVGEWPVSDAVKFRIQEGFAAHRIYFDAIVTASDSTEMRLKPHRDLYAIAIQQLGLTQAQRAQTIGFEDSAVGCLALRAAGIGLACALPWTESAGMDYSAASVICHGGLPEALLRHSLFLSS